jgi:hypothetical protein
MSACSLTPTLRERPDTIRSIVANLVGDDDSGDSLVDENEPIQPLQALETEDYNDPNWDPEPIDAGPGASSTPSFLSPLGRGVRHDRR